MIDIRGIWKYHDLLEAHSRMQVRVSKALLSLRRESCEARWECARLKEHCGQQKKDLTALRLKCGALENECEQLQAEIKKLKKIRWRWLDSEHGWWPVDGTDVYDMAQKVPYTAHVLECGKYDRRECDCR